MSESRWSASRFLSRVLGIFGAIFAPAVNPVHYAWIADLFFPLSLAALLLVFLWLSFAGAKRAMTQATTGVDVSASIALKQRPEEVPTLPLKPVSKRLRASSLAGKLVTSFVVIAALFAGAAFVIVSSFSSNVIEREVKSRAEVMTLGLHDSLASAMPAGETGVLDTVVEKYAVNKAVAFVYVEDDNGRIIAHRPGDLPRYLRRDFPQSTERALRGSRSEYRGLEIYEVAKPIAGEKPRFVHLAISRQAIAAEIDRVIVAIAGMIFLALLCIIGGFILAARALNRPLAEIAGHAERISQGDFTVPLALQRMDEVGDIARSLERLRSSLRAVTARLEHVQRDRGSNE